ncbi:hypothetical protein ACXDF8_06635 [Mycolicibacterium sp. CBM1]
MAPYTASIGASGMAPLSRPADSSQRVIQPLRVIAVVMTILPIRW